MKRAYLLPSRTLQPGELCIACQPVVLRTILGSCVGVTFWSERLGAGAMCHGVLPKCPGGLEFAATAEGHRFVDFSIRYLVRRFEAMGACRQELAVKVFGGADVLPVARVGPTVGALNCQSALEVLQEEGLQIQARDLGGVRGRRIHFHTGTGEVLVYRIQP